MRTADDVAIPQIKIGDPVLDFVLSFARMNPSLKSLSFTIYAPKPGVNERLANSATRSATDIVGDFLHHDNRPNKQWQVAVNDLTAEMLRDKIASLSADLAMALDSRCTFQDSSTKYIPMMDFKPPPDENNLEMLKEFLNRISYNGIIVDSGASYHFYGFDFLEHVQWIAFIGKCLLTPWSDSRWIGHSLIAGGGALRISANRYKQKLPLVCEVLRRNTR